MVSVFHVAQRDGAWTMEEEGAEGGVKVDNVAAAEQLAIETAQSLQRAGRPCRVVVHAEDGSVRTAHNFPTDPPRPLQPAWPP